MPYALKDDKQYFVKHSYLFSGNFRAVRNIN